MKPVSERKKFTHPIVELIEPDVELILDRYGLPIPCHPPFHVRKHDSKFHPEQVRERRFFRDSHRSYMPYEMHFVYDGVLVGSKTAQIRRPQIELLAVAAHKFYRDEGHEVADLSIYDVNGYEINGCAFANYYDAGGKLALKAATSIPFVAIAHKHALKRFLCFQLTIQENLTTISQIFCENYAARTLSDLVNLVAFERSLTRQDFHVCCAHANRYEKLEIIGPNDFHRFVEKRNRQTCRIVFQAKSIPFQDGVLHQVGVSRQDLLAAFHHQPSQGTDT